MEWAAATLGAIGAAIAAIGRSIGRLASRRERQGPYDYFELWAFQSRDLQTPGTDIRILAAARQATLMRLAEPLDIYLSDGADHAQVELAIEAWVATAGLEVLSRDDPVIGSWRRRLWVRPKVAGRSQLSQEIADATRLAIELKTYRAWDAQVTGTLLAQTAPLVTSLQSTKDAVVRLGSILLVKVEWSLYITQLTASQQLKLSHQPGLLQSPAEILAYLEIDLEQSRVIVPNAGRDTVVD